MYYRGGMKWEEYKEHQGFKDDIVRGLEKQTQSLMDVQVRAAQQISGSQNQAAADISSTLNHGFGKLIASQEEMNTVMQQGFEAVTFGLGQIKGGIEALRVDFNWAMGAVLWKMEMQQATLRNILTTLQTPLDTDAKELRKRAEVAYLNGWYDEALVDFLASEKKNYQDFAVHQAIGNIYLYKQQPADCVKAREYYLKAAKYATPYSPYHAACGYLYAGFTSYLLRDDAAAIEQSRRAIELYPKLSEAFYNHAKFSAAAARPELAIPALETAIRADRNYAVKARADADFETIAGDVLVLMDRLRLEARQKIEVDWLPLKVDLDHYAIPPTEQPRIKILQTTVEDLFVQDTYFGYLDGLPKISPLRKAFESLHLPERDRKCEESTSLLSQARARLDDCVVSDVFQKTYELKLAELQGLLRRDLTFDQSRDLLDRVREYTSPFWMQKLWWEFNPKQAVLTDSDFANEIAFSPDGSMLALVYSETVRLRNVDDRRLLTEMKGHKKFISSIAFSPDGKTLATGSADKTVRLWSVAAQCEIARLPGHSDHVSCVAFSPEGKTLASGSFDSTVRLWDVAERCELAVLKLNIGSISDLVFSPDGKTLAVGLLSKFCLFDLMSGQRKMEPVQKSLSCEIAYSPDGKTLAFGTCNGVVFLWNVAGQCEIASLPGHSDEVNSVAFSPDGKILASGSSDMTVRLWDMDTRHELAVLKGIEIIDTAMYSRVHTVTFSPDGKMLAARTRKSVHLWDMLIHKADVTRIEHLHKKEQQCIEEEKIEEEKKVVYRNSGRCEVCGEPLGILEKMKRMHQCKKHRS